MSPPAKIEAPAWTAGAPERDEARASEPEHHNLDGPGREGALSILGRWRWCVETPLSGKGTKYAAKRVLLGILGKHANKAGWCNPSQATLRRLSGLGKTVVVEAMAGLEADGKIIRRETRKTGQSGKLVRGEDEITLTFCDALDQGSRDELRSGPTKVREAADQGSRDGPTKVRDLNRKKAPTLKAPREGEHAREAFEKLFARMPESSRLGSSAKEMCQAWERLNDRPRLHDLSRAVDAWAAQPPTRKLAHYWITDETFRAYLTPGSADAEDEDSPDRWRWRMKQFRGRDRVWVESMWGPLPGRPGCRCPQSIIDEYPPRVGGVPDLGYC